MSLLIKSSLVTTPNGFKTSKLYSVVPSNGNGDLTVVRATTATRLNENGLIETISSNVPRIDYTNGDGVILIEPQSTNVQKYSEDFSNAVYTKVGCSLTTNTIVSPYGNVTADKIIEDTSNGYHTIDILQPPVTAGNYTVSVFVKAAERTKFQIEGYFALTGNVTFDLTAVTATTNSPAKNGKIQSYGNGWFRCQATFSDLTGTNAQILFNILNDSGANNYVGNGISGLYLWGAQLEAGQNGTSYIPTTSSAITRNTDLITKSNLYTNGFITNVGGTWFVELNNNIPLFRTATGTGISLSTTSSGNPTSGICIRHPSSTVQLRLTAFINYNSSGWATTSDICKLAFRWNGTTIDIFENGIKVRNDLPFTVTQMEFLRTNNEDVKKSFKSNILFPLPLTDEECINLTTL
jgi:hypothetical protein